MGLGRNACSFLLVLLSLIWLQVLSGCASQKVDGLAGLPLPGVSSGHCCWQALQRLQLDYGKAGAGQKHYQLTAALAQTDAGISLVLLDPVGRRLLSLQQNTKGELQSYRSPELPESLPARFLLASSLLAWWPVADWQQLLARDKHWQLSLVGDERLLGYKGKPVLELSYSQGAQSAQRGIGDWSLTEPLLLKHRHQPLQIRVQTLDFARQANAANEEHPAMEQATHD